jgi:hypothetical protein
MPGFNPLLAVISLAIQTPPAAPPAPVDWWSEDSARIASLRTHGRRYSTADAVVWAPADSVDPAWLQAFTDTLSAGLRVMKQLMGGPYEWQRIGQRPVTYYFSTGRFISHANGDGSLMISVSRLRQRNAPFLHEAAHELLAPRGVFAPFEHGDSAAEERAAARFHQWLSEGLPDYLAQATVSTTGFAEGDVLAIGGLAKVDSVCATRLAGSAYRAAILEKVGGVGRLAALFTTDRSVVAPVFYACSQSFTKFIVERVGVRKVVTLFPRIPTGAWVGDLEAAAGASLDSLRHEWQTRLRVGGR